MSSLITAEHLNLSPERRAQIESILGKLSTNLGREAQVRIFLKAENSHQFKVILNAHYNHRDYSVAEKGPDLIALVRASKNILLRKLREDKQRRVQLRKSTQPLGQGAA